MHPDEFYDTVERLVDRLPTAPEGTAGLSRLIAAQIEEVTAWRKLIELREKVDLELEIGKARTDVSRDGALRHRYLQDNDRSQRVWLRELRQWIQFRYKYGPDLEDHAGAAEDGPVGDSPEVVETETEAVAETETETEAVAGVPTGDLSDENRTEPGATQVADATDDPKADPAPATRAATPEPSPHMDVPSEGRGTPPADRVPVDRETIPGRQSDPGSPDPSPGVPGEKRSEPGVTQVAGWADPGMDDERPPGVSEGLRSLAAKLGVDEAEIPDMWYGRRDPSVRRRE
jgi:hypothetical protein